MGGLGVLKDYPGWLFMIRGLTIKVFSADVIRKVVEKI